MSPAANFKTPAGKRRRKMPSTPVIPPSVDDTKDKIEEDNPTTPPPASPSGVSPVGGRTRSAIKKRATPAKALTTPAKEESLSTPAPKSTAKRRGRPRKNTEDSISLAKEAGSKEQPKVEEKEKVPATPTPAAAADTEPSVTTPAPQSTTKRRGRPRKNTEDSIALQEKTPTTDKKEEQALATPVSKDTSTPAPKSTTKRRGRPRKNSESSLGGGGGGVPPLPPSSVRKNRKSIAVMKTVEEKTDATFSDTKQEKEGAAATAQETPLKEDKEINKENSTKKKKMPEAENKSTPASDTKKDIPEKDVPKKVDLSKKVDTPKKETPKKVTPKKETPKKDTPKKDTPKRDTPKKDTPKQDAPKKMNTPKKETPKKMDTAKETPKKKDTPMKDTPMKDTPKKDTPKKDTPKKDTPKKDTPKDDVPKKDTLKKDTPKKKSYPEEPAITPSKATAATPTKEKETPPPPTTQDTSTIPTATPSTGKRKRKKRRRRSTSIDSTASATSIDSKKQEKKTTTPKINEQHKKEEKEAKDSETTPLKEFTSPLLVEKTSKKSLVDELKKLKERNDKLAADKKDDTKRQKKDEKTAADKDNDEKIKKQKKDEKTAEAVTTKDTPRSQRKRKHSYDSSEQRHHHHHRRQESPHYREGHRGGPRQHRDGPHHHHHHHHHHRDGPRHHHQNRDGPHYDRKHRDDPHHRQHRDGPRHHRHDNDFSRNKTMSPPSQNVPPLISVKVHRLRNFNLIPNSILNIASYPSQKYISPHVAVSRQGGVVELLSANEKWKNKAFIGGRKDVEIDCLAWTCGGSISPASININKGGNNIEVELQKRRNLYGASRNGTIFHLNFLERKHDKVLGSGGGGVFALESLCPYCGCCSSSPKENVGKQVECGGYLAAGCEDGSVRIYRTDPEDGSIELVSTLPSAGQAVLSIAWIRPPGARAIDGIGGTILFAGAADGTIRRYDCIVDKSSSTSTSSYGQCLWRPTLRITLENRGKREPTRVWCLKALSDGTVISGDSLGLIQFWDGRSGTLIQRFEHNAENADVLTLVVNSTEKKVFASGVDPLVVCIERAPTVQQDGSMVAAPIWVNSSGWRMHTHDVRALTIVEMTHQHCQKPQEILLSGGTDTKFSTYNVDRFQKYRPQTIYNWSYVSSPITLSKKKRVLAIMRTDNIDLYQLGNAGTVSPQPSEDCPVQMDDEEGRLGSITIDEGSAQSNLTCCTISEDGNYLAASDATSLILFHLKYLDDGGDGRAAVIPTRIAISREDNCACTALRFASDGSSRLYCATSSGKIIVLRIKKSSSSPPSKEHGDDDMEIEKEKMSATLEHTFDYLSGGGSGFVPVTQLEISPDNCWLAAGRIAVGQGAVHVFALKQEQIVRSRSKGPNFASYQHWWSIPSTEVPTTCLRFLGGGEKEVDVALVVGCFNNSFYIFDVERRCMSDWSRDAGSPMYKCLPKEIVNRPECMERLALNPSTPNKFLLAGGGFFCVVDLDRPVPAHSEIYPPNHIRARRMKPLGSPESEADRPVEKRGWKNMTICLKYGGMVFLDFVDDNEMVIVEQPWLSVVNSLPDALERKVYGT